MLRNLAPLARVSTRAVSASSSHHPYTYGQGQLEQSLKDAVHRKEAATKPKEAAGGMPESVKDEDDYHNRMLWEDYVVGGENEMVGGYPEPRPRVERVAHIYQQKGWNRTAWKVDLANDDYWETRLTGPSFGDLLPNVSMHMKFASKDDAIAFCKENNWKFEVDRQ